MLEFEKHSTKSLVCSLQFSLILCFIYNKKAKIFLSGRIMWFLKDNAYLKDAKKVELKSSH